MNLNTSLVFCAENIGETNNLITKNKIFSSFELDSLTKKPKYNLIQERLRKKKLKEQNKKPKKIIKIADFGLSRSCSVPVQTLTNEVVTLWYRSPELLLGSYQYNQKSDIWSVGCIFAEMVTGNPIFKGNNVEDMLENIFQKRGSPEFNGWNSVVFLPNYEPCKWNIYNNTNLNEFEYLLDKNGSFF